MTGCEGADCGRAMHEGEVLFEVLPACECILGDELLVQAGVPDVVHDRHRRDMAHVPAAAADPETEIGLLAIQEEPLVHQTGAEERLAPHEHERP